MLEIRDVNLPEWAWLNGGDHERGGDPLFGRDVIQHVRSATTIEIFEEDKFVPAPGVKTYKFGYTSIHTGIPERFVAAVHAHPLVDDPEMLDDIVHKCIAWYTEYMMFEDREGDLYGNI